MKSILVIGARGIPDVIGGVEKNAERLFPLIANRGWKLCIAGQRPFVKSGQYKGVSLWSAPIPPFLAKSETLYAISTLIRALRMRPDLVHIAGLEPAFMLWAYKLLGCKIVVRLGADFHHRPWSKSPKWVMRCAKYQLRWADHVIAVTPALAKNLRASGIRQNIHVIGNAVDPPENAPVAAEAPISGDYILFVGQISERRNIHSLVAAFCIFVKNHPHMKLVIVGDWDKGSGREQIEALGDKRIVILGSVPRPELSPLYRGARFFVNPSIREGHSNTLLEAISCNCPILLSDLPENRDLRLDAKHYFNPGDIRSMVSALKRANATPDLFRVNSGRFPKWTEIADLTIRVYDGIFADEAARLGSRHKTSRI